MRTFRLTGNYGTFEIQRVVEADDYDHAWSLTGIVSTLEAAGWTFTESPDGEDWVIEELLDDEWVERGGYDADDGWDDDKA